MPTYPADFQPATFLWDLYHPESAPLRFQARSIEEALAWQHTTRQELARAIGFQDTPRVDPEPELDETVERPDVIRQRWVIRTSAHSRMPVYLVRPKNATGKLPLVLAFHGHGYGVKDIVGLWEDGSERLASDGYHQDFAIQLARKGFLVAAPEISCFGERANDYSHLDTVLGQPEPYTCHHMATLAFHLGGSMIGLRAFDARCLLDYLVTLPEVDAQRIGAMGISGGGMHTLYSAALDERIRASVISGYYSTFRDSIFGMHHCTCNFVPGLGRFGEMHDIIGLVAPRPVLVESGSRDPIFPRASVEYGVARGKQVYSVFGAEDRLVPDYFEGRHQIHGAMAYDFLWEQLK